MMFGFAAVGVGVAVAVVVGVEGEARPEPPQAAPKEASTSRKETGLETFTVRIVAYLSDSTRETRRDQGYRHDTPRQAESTLIRSANLLTCWRFPATALSS